MTQTSEDTDSVFLVQVYVFQQTVAEKQEIMKFLSTFPVDKYGEFIYLLAIKYND